MAEGGGVPSLRDWLSNWLGFHIPTVSMPQTVKNLDKAVSRILLAAGENVEVRIKANGGKHRAKGKIDVEGMYRTEEEKRKLENRAATVRVAIDEMNQDPSKQDAKQEIDEDWLNLYARIAEEKTSEELQSLFGKILAGEVRNPGKFSLRTLQFVSTLSREEAHKISTYFSFVLSARIVPNPSDINAEKNPGFSTRMLMEELGIASAASSIGGLSLKTQIGPGDKLPFIGTGLAIMVANDLDTEVQFELPGQALTRPGQELLAIASPPNTPLDYAKQVAQIVFTALKRRHSSGLTDGKIVVSVVDVVSDHGGLFLGRTLYTASVQSGSN